MMACDFAALTERLRRSAVQVVSGNGGGSGVVWDATGVVVTNAHVVSIQAGSLRGNRTEVVDYNGRRFPAFVTALDRRRDLAAIETGQRGLEPAVAGDSSDLKAGQIVIAIGNPAGIRGAVSTGIIHSGSVNEFGRANPWIQADIRLAPGNSGGILADAEGRVIGINTMIFRGLGLAVPSNEVCAFLNRVRRNSWRTRAA